MLKGIVIIATSHAYYGRMAYNLAVTIKATEDVLIALLYRSPAIDHLNGTQLSYFDHLINLPEDVPAGYQTKLHLDELSPFDNTLYLDADMLWLPYRKPSELFAELSGNEYTGITEGKVRDVNHGYYFWADLAELQQVYGSDWTFHQWRSEVIYFEKGTPVFATARSLDLTELRTAKKFGGCLPDELYLNIATALLCIEPHKYKWTPAYWPRLYKDVIPKDLSSYYLLSFGSNYASSKMKTTYRTVLTSACNKLGIRPMFGLDSKRSFMKERQKM
jgi:hypothetical protein